MTVSTLRMPRKIHYGKNAFNTLGEEAEYLGKKGLIVSDSVMDKLGNIKKCEVALKEKNVQSVTYLGIESEPTDKYIEEALELFKTEDCQFIIALGGGSCIDTAKGVAVIASNGGDISDYMNNQTIAKQSPVPLIAIPTTSGTGSEVTDVTTITNTRNDVKMMIKQIAFLPSIAIVDPEFSISSPPKTTSATGVDALTHAIEAYISKKAHPFTDMLALSAIKTILYNIKEAYHDGNNLEARDKMAYAAMQAGMAFSDSSVCLVHGMSRPIGAIFKVPHGISNAMLMPAIMEYNLDACIDELAQIADNTFDDIEHYSNEEKAKYLIQEIKNLCSELNIPNLKEWGVDKTEFENALSKMAKDALESGSPGNNPKVPEEEEIISLYRTCYDYAFNE